METLTVAAPVVAIVALYLIYYRLGRSHLGADDDWWEFVRRVVLPPLNTFARRNGFGYAAYELSDAEYVGQLGLPPEQVEKALEALGFERMPLAAFKYAPDGRPEVGSWARREEHPLVARRQDHVMLFGVGEGPTDYHGTDLYAHNEFNAFNPLTALPHYLGIDYNPALGVARVRELLRHYGGHVLRMP